MARDASGNHTLIVSPAAVSGATISATDHNLNMNDISAEITDSLSRSGEGGMTAALKGTNGTVGAPAVSFTDDPDTGIYREAANTPAMAAAGTKSQSWTSTGTAIPGTLAVTGTTTGSAKGTFTGTGSSDGLQGISSGESTSGVNGTVGAGSTDGFGVAGTGKGAGQGGRFTGGTSAAGVYSAAGTSSTGAAPTVAVVATNGGVTLQMTNPNSTAAPTANTLYSSNICKAWGTIDISNANPFVPTVDSGFNITSVARQSDSLARVTFATAMGNANYAVIITPSVGWGTPSIPTRATTHFDVIFEDDTGANVDLDSNPGKIMFVVFGIQ